MPSFRSRLLLMVMKHRHLLRLRFKRAAIDWNAKKVILRFREECESTRNNEYRAILPRWICGVHDSLFKMKNDYYYSETLGIIKNAEFAKSRRDGAERKLKNPY